MSMTYYHPKSNQFYDEDWSVFDRQFPAELGIGPYHHSHHLQTNAMTHLLSADLIESEKDFQVHADLPGVSAENLDVSIVGKNLVIQAERKHVHESGNSKIHCLERSYGKATRSVRIPKNVDFSKVTTKFENGVLSITMPKHEAAPVVPIKLDVEVVK